ncbi:Kinesin, putative [Hondaea fermentalgiana]|uniref:Kinesin, putative n=1 Tax=Hondaea fermentalgiana TaxID=2315210 RepID=A0A2R5G331_9STRA|nr:Kinesin, putative [Hondaea fermentalgiana]|eukprot:GBG25436.1 Kinesin, putative [Hondaea fermentalgiana]
MFINRLAFGSFKTGLEDNLRRAVESMENVVKNNFGDEDEEASDHYRQIEVYKQLLVEMELGQLKVLREYQKLFAEKEARIADLTSKQDIDSNNIDNNTTNPVASDNKKGSADHESGEGDTDETDRTRQEEAKDDAEWVRDWEAQMKTNISEKMDALVQAREHRETARILREQLDSLKDHVRAQDAKVDQLERLENLRKDKEQGDENALDTLALEYSKLSQEAEEASQRANEMARERDELRKQCERQREQLTVLVQTGAGGPDASAAAAALAENSTALENMARMESKLEDRERELEQLRARLAEYTTSEAKAKEDIAQERDANTKALEAQLETLRISEIKLQEQLASAQAISEANQAEDQTEEMRTLRETLENKTTEIASLKALQEKLEGEAESLREKSSTLQKELDTAGVNAASSVEEQQKEISSLRQDLDAKTAALQKAECARKEIEDDFKARIATLQERETDLVQKISALEEKSLEMQQAFEAKETQLEALRGEIKTLRESFESQVERLESEVQSARASETEANERLGAAEKDANALRDEVASREAALEEKSRALDESEQAMATARESHETAMTSVQAKLQQSVQQLKESSTALADLEKLKEEMEREHEEEREEAAKIRAEIEDTFHSTVERLEEEMERREQESLAGLAQFKQEFEERLANTEAERDAALAATEEVKRQAEAAQAAALAALEDELMGQVDEYRQRYIRESSLRKRVHNELMDLKGNIRVYCRVRPVLPMERKRSSTDALDVTSFPVENEIEITRDEASTNRFEFDAVFAQKSTQEQVFEDISPLVTSTLDGYDVCIFAYGQTGSGKTFTMEGSRENPGVNLRALQRLFQLRHDRREEETFAFSVSILEIYNESVRDLLARSDAGPGPRAKLDLRVASNGTVFVQDLQSVQVDCMEDVEVAMRRAQGNRAVGAHSMNEHSSRSHLVFMLSIEGRNHITGLKTRSKLNLIDLAGSERVSKTDASGDRLKEAQNINKSLSALGDVIAALGDAKARQQHVPYRNSKLTHLLQNSLGGGSKVAMFVNISPVQINAPESICSLNFAARCRKVQLGQAKRKGGDSAELKKYKRIVEDLRAQIAGSQTRSLSASTSSLSSLTGSSAGTPRKSRKLITPASASK